MTIARGYSQRIRHLSSLESMIYFSTSQKGYVCHRTLKGLLEIASGSRNRGEKGNVEWFSNALSVFSQRLPFYGYFV